MSNITKSNRTIVYILGAGASAEDGAPVMAELLDKAFWNFGGKLKFYNRHLIGIIDNESELNVFRSVFELIDYFYGERLVEKMEKLYEGAARPYSVGTVDIEDFFTRIDNMLKGKETYGLNWGQQKILQIAKDAGFFFYHTLCLETGLNRAVPKHYPAFVENALVSGVSHCVITFNYDMLLEKALCDMDKYFNNAYRNPVFNRNYFNPPRFPWTYGLPFVNVDWPSAPYHMKDENLAEIYYFKLHGSLNWGICPVTKGITMHAAVADAWIYRRFYQGRYKCHNGQHISQPLLIPPTRFKDLDVPGLKIAWKKAAKFLKETEEVHVIGYSLPDADTGAQELFSNNLRHNLKRLIIANPNPKHRDKFKNILGNFSELIEYDSFKKYLMDEYKVGVASEKTSNSRL